MTQEERRLKDEIEHYRKLISELLIAGKMTEAENVKGYLLRIKSELRQLRGNHG